MSSVNVPVSSVTISPSACLQTPENAPTALWSAATGRRFVRLADLSAEQRRVERRENLPEPTAHSGIVRPTTFDGDKSPSESGDESPHSKGFALNLGATLLQQAFSTPRLIFYLISGLLAMPAATAEDAAQDSPVFVSDATVRRMPIRGEVIINRTSWPWESQQVQEPCILPNPKDRKRLVMFYSGVPATNRNTCFIGKAWALKSDPFTWHQDEHNPVFSPGKQGWDSGSIRLDAVLYLAEEDAYYIYYSGAKGSVQDRIGLAICPAGADGYSGITPAAIQRVGSQPVLAPEPAAPFFEEMASQAAVLRERDAKERRWNWFMYYSYRGKDGILPGLRLATSRDGKNWTRHFNEKDPRGMGQIFESTPGAYYEWHQAFKIGDTYFLSIEVGISAGKRWRPVIAVSKNPATGWTQTDVDAVLQTKWEGLYRDDTIYHVATPAFYEIGGKWYLYTQACPLPANGNYIDGHWDMWCFACDRLIPTLPGYESIYIPGKPADPRGAR